MKTPTLLCILDGFGFNPNLDSNAVAAAYKPNFDSAWQNNPHTTLTTFGENVGLPEGQMGNSEVGHMNIGAGRVVDQWLLRISKALEGNFLDSNPEYQKFMTQLSSSRNLHLIGLVSDGGVHSHLLHLKQLIKRIRPQYTGQMLIHVLTDGRDTPPQSAAQYVEDLQQFIQGMQNCRIATICGRFFAMDRDKRWERVEKAFRTIAYGEATKALSACHYLQGSYQHGITDEFLEPACFDYQGIEENDSAIFWNYREDRMRQIVAALCQSNFTYIPRHRFSGSAHATAPFQNPERVLCFTEYDHSLQLPFIFKPLEIKNHLGEYISGLGLKQLRVAETEKYPHVTYFFNAGIEPPYPLEERVLIPSPREVKTYDLKPEMSAQGVTDVVVSAIQRKNVDLIVVNLANCDMVGHTGVLSAAIKAVETVDVCLGRMLSALQSTGGKGILIADHGNAEQMVDYRTGAPYTSHTMYPVPCIIFGCGDKLKLRDGGALCDVAPTILKMMNLAKPVEMSGNSLF